MREACNRTFDESLLSGYVDQALVQRDDQQVRLHLEQCASCRAIVAELHRTREVTMSTSFKVPEDLQWSERPSTPASRFSRGTGWLLILLWIAGVAGWAMWLGWTEWRSGGLSVTDLLPFAGVFGLVLLFVGVLIDRLRALRTDRYREVEK